MNTTHVIDDVERHPREIVEAGLLSGVVGGLAMALVSIVYNLVVGRDVWTPIAAITATALRTSIHVTFATVAVGIGIHLLVSMVWGVVFAAVVRPEVPAMPALAFGAFTGVVALVTMTWGIIPFLNPSVGAHMLWGSAPNEVPVLVAFMMHIAFGAGLALAPRLRRQFA